MAGPKRRGASHSIQMTRLVPHVSLSLFFVMIIVIIIIIWMGRVGGVGGGRIATATGDWRKSNGRELKTAAAAVAQSIQ